MEPTYEFIRGSGWVVSTAPFLDFEVNGKRWRIIARKPNVGERCCWSSVTKIHFVVKWFFDWSGAWSNAVVCDAYKDGE